jgi:hypothetical protein
MKKALVSFLVVCLSFLAVAAPAGASLGIGYETLTVFPHALTLNYWDKDSGWGVKGSADFGTSALSLGASIISIIGTVGLSGATEVSFVTLALTKDFHQEENARSYFKLGALALSGKVAGEMKTGYLPIVGAGWEWQKLFGGNWAFSSELSIPELWTLGLKYYF